MKTFTMIVAASALVAVLTVPSVAQGGSFGCLGGGALGGYGGSQIGNGTSKTVATIAGTLLGCGVGSNLQDRDAARYQQQQYQQQQYQQQQYQRQGVIFSDRPSNHYSQYDKRYQGGQQWQNVTYYQPAYQQPTQRACPYVREVQWQVVVGGRVVDAYGPGCSWDGGRTWQILSSN